MLVSAGVGSWEYIDEYMTVPRFVSLQNYWSKWPPVHISAALIAAGLGALRPEPKRADTLTEMAGAGITVPGVKRG